MLVKLEWLGYRWWKNYDDMLSRFICYRNVTNRQTDRIAISISRVSVLTRDKNRTVIDCLQLLDTKTRDDEKWRHFRKAAFAFSGWIGYSKLDRVKTMGTHGKIRPNAIWWNIEINVRKLVDVCGYEFPTKLQNFMQKDLTKVKIFQKVLGVATFFWNTLYTAPSKFWWHSTVPKWTMPKPYIAIFASVRVPVAILP